MSLLVLPVASVVLPVVPAAPVVLPDVLAAVNERETITPATVPTVLPSLARTLAFNICDRRMNWPLPKVRPPDEPVVLPVVLPVLLPEPEAVVATGVWVVSPPVLLEVVASIVGLLLPVVLEVVASMVGLLLSPPVEVVASMVGLLLPPLLPAPLPVPLLPFVPLVPPPQADRNRALRTSMLRAKFSFFIPLCELLYLLQTNKLV